MESKLNAIHDLIKNERSYSAIKNALLLIKNTRAGTIYNYITLLYILKYLYAYIIFCYILVLYNALYMFIILS